MLAFSLSSFQFVKIIIKKISYGNHSKISQKNRGIRLVNFTGLIIQYGLWILLSSLRKHTNKILDFDFYLFTLKYQSDLKHKTSILST